MFWDTEHGDGQSELKRIKLAPEAAPVKEIELGSESDGDNIVYEEEDEDEEEEETYAVADHPMWSEEETEESVAATLAHEALQYGRFWDVCKRISEAGKAGDEFYRSLLKAIASLILAIYDLEDLHRHAELFPKPLIDEMILFLNELDQLKLEYRDYKSSTQLDTCKWLLENIEWKKYALIQERDIHYLLYYCTREVKFPPRFSSEYVFFGYEEMKRKGLCDDFQKALRSVKASKTLTTDDRGIVLWKEFVFGGHNLQEEWLAKTMKEIDTDSLYELDCETLKKLMFPYSLNVEPSTHESIIFFVKYSIDMVIASGKMLIEALMDFPYKIWFPLQFHFDCIASPDVNDLIQLAGMCRKANGCRFISRQHFRWAFDEAKLEYSEKWRSLAETTMDAEDAADRPLYSVYLTSLLLASSLGSRTLHLEHFVYAVFFGFKMDYSHDELTKMKEDFAKYFSDGTRMRMVSFSSPPDYSDPETYWDLSP